MTIRLLGLFIRNAEDRREWYEIFKLLKDFQLYHATVSFITERVVLKIKLKQSISANKSYKKY